MADERILIADDQEDILELCMRALSQEGYQVAGAHTGAEAVEIARSGDFDLLLTDVRMPGMSGLQAFQKIKAEKPEIVGVAITGYGAIETVIDALKLGMDDFILKPFSLNELGVAIARALQKKRLERENARLNAMIPLYRLSQAFMSVIDEQVLMRQVMQVALNETNSHVGCLMLRGDSGPDLACHSVAVSSGETPSPEACAVHAEIVNEVLETTAPLIWTANGGPSFFAGEGITQTLQTAVALPLVVKGDVIGVLGLAKAPGASDFAPGDLELLSVLAGQIAIAIQNARLYTRLQDAYEKLASLDHLKSEFISIAAHELRTPLAIISSYADLIEPEVQGQTKEHVATIEQAAAHLRRVIEDMTSLKSLEARQMELQLAPVSLNALVQDVLEPLQPVAASKKHTIVVDIPAALPLLRIDGDKIRIVLRNLITNAIDFTPTGGRVTIRATAEDGGVRVAVQDTGIGIEQGEREWIFKPFYQLESSLLREHGGIGLGLALARSLVQLHGGRIWVNSAAGKGSTFFFTLPHCYA